MKKKFTSVAGFTLVEMLVVVGIIILLAALALPIYSNFIAASQNENISRDVQETLRRAQNKAQASNSNSQWGVHFNNASFILFRGESWSARDASYDENHPAGWGISIMSSQSDIIFTKSGTTTFAGLITISDKSGNNKIITINGEGLVDLQ